MSVENDDTATTLPRMLQLLFTAPAPVIPLEISTSNVPATPEIFHPHISEWIFQNHPTNLITAEGKNKAPLRPSAERSNPVRAAVVGPAPHFLPLLLFTIRFPPAHARHRPRPRPAGVPSRSAILVQSAAIPGNYSPQTRVHVKCTYAAPTRGLPDNSIEQLRAGVALTRPFCFSVLPLRARTIQK